MKKILLSLVVFSFLTVFSTNQAQARSVTSTVQLGGTVGGCIFVSASVTVTYDDETGHVTSYSLNSVLVGDNCRGTQMTLFEQQAELIKKAFKAKKITKNQKDGLMKQAEILK